MKQINNIYVTYREIYQNLLCCTSTSTITEQKNSKVKKKFFLVCRVSAYWHSAKKYFAECHEHNTRHIPTLPSAITLTLGKHWLRNGIGTVPGHMAGTCSLCLVQDLQHSAKPTFAVCLELSTRQYRRLPCVRSPTLGKRHSCRVSKLCRVPFI